MSSQFCPGSAYNFVWIESSNSNTDFFLTRICYIWQKASDYYEKKIIKYY